MEKRELRVKRKIKKEKGKRGKKKRNLVSSRTLIFSAYGN